jgi:hypothetical protein
MAKKSEKNPPKVNLKIPDLEGIKNRSISKTEGLPKEKGYDKRMVEAKLKRRGEKKPFVLKSEHSFTRINTIQQIIIYVNQLTTERIELVTDLSRNMEQLGYLLPDSVRDEYNTLWAESEIIEIGMNISPIVYKFINDDASSVQLDLIRCISVVQDVLDKGRAKGIIVGHTEVQFFTLMGALDELCYRINPDTNELVSLSQDQTHLRKNVMAIYSNASKLISIETELIGEDKEANFMKHMAILPQSEQLKQIEDYVIPNFRPEWIEKLDYDIIQRILNLIVRNPELDITVSPTILLDLFKRFKMNDRKEFLSYMKVSLVGGEIELFTKKE